MTRIAKQPGDTLDFVRWLATEQPGDMLDQIEQNPVDWFCSVGVLFEQDSEVASVCTTSEAAEIAFRHGYDVQARWLQAAIDAGDLRPKSFGCEYAWGPSDVIALMRLLHTQRRFQLLAHHESKTEEEHRRDCVTAAHLGETADYYATLPIEELRQRLPTVSDRNAATAMRWAILRKREELASEDEVAADARASED